MIYAIGYFVVGWISVTLIFCIAAKFSGGWIFTRRNGVKYFIAILFWPIVVAISIVCAIVDTMMTLSEIVYKVFFEK